MGVSSKTANPTYNVIISMRNILALVILVILAIYGYSDASPQGPPPRPQRPQRTIRPQLPQRPIRPPTGSSTFRLIIVNLAFPKLAAGTVTFLGNGNRKCAQSYSTKNETALLPSHINATHWLLSAQQSTTIYPVHPILPTAHRSRWVTSTLCRLRVLQEELLAV